MEKRSKVGEREEREVGKRERGRENGATAFNARDCIVRGTMACYTLSVDRSGSTVVSDGISGIYSYSCRRERKDDRSFHLEKAEKVPSEVGLIGAPCAAWCRIRSKRGNSMGTEPTQNSSMRYVLDTVLSSAHNPLERMWDGLGEWLLRSSRSRATVGV